MGNSLFNYSIQFIDGKSGVIHFSHSQNTLISSENRAIKVNKGDDLVVSLIGVEGMDIHDNSIKFENADNVALICIENPSNHEWVTMDIGVKGNKEHLGLLKTLIQEKTDEVLRQAFDNTNSAKTSSVDTDSTKDGLIKLAMLLVGVLSIWGIAQAFHPSQNVNTAINEATPTAQKLISQNPLDGSNIELNEPTSTLAPATAIKSVQDMTPENLQAYNGHITDEVRKQVLEQMGIDMDELESLNDCVVE